MAGQFDRRARKNLHPAVCGYVPAVKYVSISDGDGQFSIGSANRNGHASQGGFTAVGLKRHEIGGGDASGGEGISGACILLAVDNREKLLLVLYASNQGAAQLIDRVIPHINNGLLAID